MYLITKNKIADYIEQHPEAQTAFLTWVKEFPYAQGKNLFNRGKDQSLKYMLTGWFGLGRGDYSIQYKFNPWLKTGYIVWLGTKEALIEHEEKEFVKMKAQHPGLERKTIKITGVIQAPHFPGRVTNHTKDKADDQSETKETLQVAIGVPVDLRSVHLSKLPEIFPSTIDGHIASELDLKTKTEYENALNKAISLFDARPETPEFDELTILLPLIRHYEASNIELPQLAIWEAIKLKMEQLDMPSSFLVMAIGGQDEADCFLTGKNSLPEKTLQAVCDLLFLRIPLNDKSLIK